MKIINVYDFKGPNGYFFNALDFDLLDVFKEYDFTFDKHTLDNVKDRIGNVANLNHNIVSNDNSLLYDIDIN